MIENFVHMIELILENGYQVVYHCNFVDWQYGNDPQSWFQKQIRGQQSILYDHISKEMNELNYIRCQRIPKRPGSDWRDLPEEKVRESFIGTVQFSLI